MQTDGIPDLFGFEPVEGRPVVTAFDGGSITSDAGAMLLGAADRAIGLIDRFAACFHDARRQELIEHEVETLIGQRVFGLAAGYEDLIDHDQLRHDPVMAILVGKLKARREDCAPAAGKSTLNRLELSRPEPTRYHKISHDGAMIEILLIELFLEAHRRPPKQIISSISTPPTTRCTAIRKAASSTATTIAIATCRFTYSAAAICWRRSFARLTSTLPPEFSKRSPGSSRGSAPVGRTCAFCCAPIRVSPAKH